MPNSFHKETTFTLSFNTKKNFIATAIAIAALSLCLYALSSATTLTISEIVMVALPITLIVVGYSKVIFNSNSKEVKLGNLITVDKNVRTDHNLANTKTATADEKVPPVTTPNHQSSGIPAAPPLPVSQLLTSAPPPPPPPPPPLPPAGRPSILSTCPKINLKKASTESGRVDGVGDGRGPLFEQIKKGKSLKKVSEGLTIDQLVEKRKKESAQQSESSARGNGQVNGGGDALLQQIGKETSLKLVNQKATLLPSGPVNNGYVALLEVLNTRRQAIEGKNSNPFGSKGYGAIHNEPETDISDAEKSNTNDTEWDESLLQTLSLGNVRTSTPKRTKICVFLSQDDKESKENQPLTSASVFPSEQKEKHPAPPKPSDLSPRRAPSDDLEKKSSHLKNHTSPEKLLSVRERARKFGHIVRQ